MNEWLTWNEICVLCFKYSNLKKFLVVRAVLPFCSKWTLLLPRLVHSVPLSIVLLHVCKRFCFLLFYSWANDCHGCFGEPWPHNGHGFNENKQDQPGPGDIPECGGDISSWNRRPVFILCQWVARSGQPRLGRSLQSWMAFPIRLLLLRLVTLATRLCEGKRFWGQDHISWYDFCSIIFFFL